MKRNLTIFVLIVIGLVIAQGLSNRAHRYPSSAYRYVMVGPNDSLFVGPPDSTALYVSKSQRMLDSLAAVQARAAASATAKDAVLSVVITDGTTYADSTITELNPRTSISFASKIAAWKGIAQKYNKTGITWNKAGIDTMRIFLGDTVKNGCPYWYQVQVRDGSVHGNMIAQTKKVKLTPFIKRGTAPHDTIFTWTKNAAALYDSTLTTRITITDAIIPGSTYAISYKIYDKANTLITAPYAVGIKYGSYPGYSYSTFDGSVWKTTTADSSKFLMLTQMALRDTTSVKEKVALVDVKATNASTSAINAYNLADSIRVRDIKKIPSVNMKIALQGTSITWGQGDLVDTTSTVSGYLMHELTHGKFAYGLMAKELTWAGTSTPYNNAKLLGGRARQIVGTSNANYVDFYWPYDELHIGYVAKRTTEYGEITVRADGAIVGQFTNFNPTMGTATDSFTWTVNGTDTTKSYQLKYPHTYDHDLVVGGVQWTARTIAYATATGIYTRSTANKIANLVRTWDPHGNVRHSLIFPNDLTLAAGTVITTSYNYGRMYGIENSTVGQFDDALTSVTNTDSLNECNYGIGGTQYDIFNPGSISSGMEFRDVNPDAVWSMKLDLGGPVTNTPKRKLIRIRVTGGSAGAYMIINYVSNKKHYLLNAGIGGLSVPDVVGTKYKNLGWKNIYKKYSPDMIFSQSGGGNEGFLEIQKRHIKRMVTGVPIADVKALSLRGNVDSIKYQVGTDDYDVRYTSGLITSITNNSLMSNDLVTSVAADWGCHPAVGDIIRIGTHYGDVKEFQTRVIKAINTDTGYIAFDKPIIASQFMNVDSLPDLVGAEIQIRKLAKEFTDLKSFVDSLRQSDSNTKIFFVESENSAQDTRAMWGYERVMEALADSLKGVSVVKVFDRFQENCDSYIYGASTGTYRDSTLTSDLTEIYVTYAGTSNQWPNSHWQGFAVYKNGQNIYGKDCYFQSRRRYAVSQTGTGSALNVTAPYSGSIITSQNGSFVWRKNSPSALTNLKFLRAAFVWSSDFTHPNRIGARWYGDIYSSYIDKHLNR